MKKTSPHIITSSFLAVICAVAVGIYAFLYIQIKNTNEHVSIVQNEAEAQEIENNGQQSLEDILNNTKEDREKIASIVLSDDKVVDFLESVEALGPLTNTTVTTASVNVNDATGKDTGFLTLQMNVAGSWQNVLQFASLIENMPYQITITDASFTGEVQKSTDKKKSQSVKWRAQLNVSVVKDKINE